MPQNETMRKFTLATRLFVTPEGGLLSIAKAAARLGTRPKLLKQRAERNQLPFVCEDGELRVPLQVVEEHLRDKLG